MQNDLTILLQTSWGVTDASFNLKVDVISATLEMSHL